MSLLQKLSQDLTELSPHIVRGLGLALLSILIAAALALTGDCDWRGCDWHWLGLGSAGSARESVTVLTLSVAAVLLQYGIGWMHGKTAAIKASTTPLDHLGAILVAAYVRCMLAAAVRVNCTSDGAVCAFVSFL